MISCPWRYPNPERENTVGGDRRHLKKKMYNLLLSMIFNGEIRIIEKEKEIQAYTHTHTYIYI